MPIGFTHGVVSNLVSEVQRTLTATNTQMDSAAMPAGGVDPSLLAAAEGRDSEALGYINGLDDDSLLAYDASNQALEHGNTAGEQIGGIDPSAVRTETTSGDAAMAQAQQAAQAQQMQAAQAQQAQQQQAAYQQHMNQQQQMQWQQAMAQQAQRVQMAQMNAAAQQQAMQQAGASQNLDVDEIAGIIAELYADEGNHVEGYDDGNGEDSRRTLEAADVDALDVSEVSFEKVSGGTLSDDEVIDLLNEAADLNGISTDPEIRDAFITTFKHMGEHESGNPPDPNSGNNWDSNARGDIQSDGLPAQSSRGWLQCIPETFAANHVAGTSTSIYDPLASAAASMRYVMNRYDVGADGENLENFASRRGIDAYSGEVTGSYLGY